MLGFLRFWKLFGSPIAENNGEDSVADFAWVRKRGSATRGTKEVLGLFRVCDF